MKTVHEKFDAWLNGEIEETVGSREAWVCGYCAALEEAAKVCEEMSKVKANDEWEAGMAYGQQGCAAAIRALKNV